jgi:hypothetical protein
MSRLIAALPLPPKPVSVALGELAIAAGPSVRSATRTSPPQSCTTICDADVRIRNLYRYCIRYAEGTEVQHVQTLTNLCKPTERIDRRVAIRKKMQPTQL